MCSGTTLFHRQADSLSPPNPDIHVIHQDTPCTLTLLHAAQVLSAIEAIGNCIFDLAEAGYPMPRELTYYDHIGDTFMPDLMRPPLYRIPGVEYTPPDPQWERVQRLGYNWQALDLRAHVEKRAAKKLRAEVDPQASRITHPCA